MRALTLTQPWAQLVALSAKKIETRSWSTSFRGRLAIHAAKGWTRDDQQECSQAPFREVLRSGCWYPAVDSLPRGAIVATCELVDCLRIGRTVGGAVVLHGSRPILVAEPELSFGNYEPGRWGWVLANVVPLLEPVPARGALGLWTWEPAQIEAAAR